MAFGGDSIVGLVCRHLGHFVTQKVLVMSDTSLSSEFRQTRSKLGVASQLRAYDDVAYLRRRLMVVRVKDAARTLPPDLTDDEFDEVIGVIGSSRDREGGA